MRTIYLHVGLPKTATSAIQQFLTDNSRQLSDKGYCYRHMPFKYLDKSSPKRNAHFLVEELYDENGKPDSAAKKARIEDGLKIIEQWFTEYDNIILTDESFWNLLRGKNWEDFARLLKFCEEHNAVLKMIVYLRRQDDYMLSWWRQRVRMGGRLGKLPDWEDFIQAPPAVLILDFAKHLREIEEYMPKENIIARIYDKNGFVGKNHTIFSDFLDAIGLEFTDDFEIEKPIVNSSMTDDYAEIKRILNRLQSNEYSRAYNEVSKFFEKTAIECSALSDYDEKYSLLTEENSAYIMGKYAESNKEICERYFPDKEDLFGTKTFDKEKWTMENPEMLDSVILYFGEMALRQQTEIKQLKKKLEETEKLVNENRSALKAMSKIARPAKKIYKKIHKKK